MYYELLKGTHIGCAALSLTGFMARGLLAMRSSSVLQARWVRILPHVVDTALLVSALLLVVATHQFPGREAWLDAKLCGVVAYIVLGTVALKRAKTPRFRLAAWLAALVVFAYIVSVALTKDPRGVFIWI